MVGVRNQDIIKLAAPQAEDSKQIREQKASRIDTNILFGNWKKSDSSLCETCFNLDIQQFSFKDLAKNETEIFEVQQIIKDNY